MNDNIKRSSTKQYKQHRAQLIEDAKHEWSNKAQQLAQEKANIGYKEFSWEAFLEIMPDDSFDTVKQSQIIELQQRYNELLEEQKKIWQEDLIVQEFNQKNAIVRVDQTYILTEKYNQLGGKDFSLESRNSFRTYYEDEIIECIDGSFHCKADIWLKSPNRRKYEGIIFDPANAESNGAYYNLWRGFSKIPIKGDCSKYWEHVRNNICSNDENTYTYIRKWISYVFQHPDEVHTALVLCGSQGVGKNSFVEPLGVLLGSHYVLLSSITELVSNFNYHLKNAVLIHANEALWGGNKKEIGTVKAMITERTCLIEGKGKDRIMVRNFKHIILSSNEDWPVALDPDDRRFFVMRVSESRKEDTEYFKAIQDQLDNGGYEALLHDLLHEDINNFDPRKIPSSSHAFHIKIRSAESCERYIYECLKEQSFSLLNLEQNAYPEWQIIVSKKDVYQDYVNWCDMNREKPMSQELFGRSLRKLIPSITETRPGSGYRPRCYKLPSLEQARIEFCNLFKEEVSRIFLD